MCKWKIKWREHQEEQSAKALEKRSNSRIVGLSRPLSEIASSKRDEAVLSPFRPEDLTPNLSNYSLGALHQKKTSAKQCEDERVLSSSLSFGDLSQWRRTQRARKSPIYDLPATRMLPSATIYHGLLEAVSRVMKSCPRTNNCLFLAILASAHTADANGYS